MADGGAMAYPNGAQASTRLQPATWEYIERVGPGREQWHGLPGGDRTPDPQLRRLLLYPTELRAEIERKDMVGAKGFEPSTLWSQTRCATRLRYAPTCRYCSRSRRRFCRQALLYRPIGEGNSTAREFDAATGRIQCVHVIAITSTTPAMAGAGSGLSARLWGLG